MARETDAGRVPGGGEDRIVECPVCSNTMTKMEAEGVTVDVCAGGCGGIWFDWFELTHLDEAEESAGEKFLEVDRDPTLQVDLSKRNDYGVGSLARLRGLRTRSWSGGSGMRQKERVETFAPALDAAFE